MKKVIIAKDIRAILEKKKTFLDRSAVRLFSAPSNEKVLALHRAIKADLIIAKLNMPEMSGETLCSLIRDDEELRHISIIIVCSENESDLARCIQCRANAFISSPIDTELLLQEAHRLLNIAPRTSYRIPIRVKFFGKSKQRVFTGYTENLSSSGMLLCTMSHLFEGDSVMCSFSVPVSTQITVQAEVVRVLGKDEHNANCYGIKFTDLSASATSAIQAFVKKGSESG
ncbi:MAG TPA: PilZ domain-containing protein [Thermodesulfovibrionales bacterium]|nr:PilZ domain-containing protein [Thermodesulfovibrionales bacterium]